MAVVVAREGDGRGGDAALTTARTFPADAAVGLLSRERSTFRGTLGGSGGGGTLRDLAREAAVGANRPEEGSKEARGVAAPAPAPAPAEFFDDGVFGREPGVAGVGALALMLAGVERGRVDGALRVPAAPPFDGGVRRGVGVLERAARAAVPVAVAGGGRVPGDEVDFVGDAGVVLEDLGGAVYGRDVEGADTRGLIGCVGAGAGAGAVAVAVAVAVAGASCAMMETSPPTVDATVLGAAGDSKLGANDAGTTRSGSAPSSNAVGPNAMSAAVGKPRSVTAEGGGLSLVLVVPLALPLPFVLTGGHSRAMRCSSFAASLVLFDVALVARDGGPDDVGWRFCCCSKRPMRFATDWRGRSSGSGLLEAARRIRRSNGKMNT